MIAAILQLVTYNVKTSPAREMTRKSAREESIAGTEHRILTAAQVAFLENGYAATSLVQVAEQAGVSPRTVYVRFGTKAALLGRVVDVAVVGDAAPVPVMERDWAQLAFTAPSLTERIAAYTRSARNIMERAGGLFRVAQEAALTEPLIRSKCEQGRQGTRSANEAFWQTLVADGLLPATADGTTENPDLVWVMATTSLLGSADNFIQIGRLYNWDLDTYEEWLRTTYSRLAQTLDPASRP